jgi:hypothetical protein
MGTIKLSKDSWACKSCGNSVVREHPQEQCCLTEAERDAPGFWTTREQREAHPEWLVCRIQHLLYVCDWSWMACDDCDLELSQEERQVVNGIMSKIDWSKVTMHEEIGIGVINDCAVARFPVEDGQNAPHVGKPMAEADYERLKGKTLYVIGEPKFFGEMPVRTELTVLPADKSR